MRSVIAIAGFLGAGAAAHPSFQHRHLHNKRDTFVTSTMGNEVLVEDIHDVYVTVIAGQLPSSPTSIPLAVPENRVVEASPASVSTGTPAVQEKYALPVANGQEYQLPVPSYTSVELQAPIETSDPLSSVTPIVVTVQASDAAPSPSPLSTPVAAAAAPAASPAASSQEASDTYWATSPLSPLGGGPGAKDILTQANYWRKQWKNLPPFTWSSVLAKNSYMTAINFEGKDPENPIVHHLYPGSSSQCEGEGDGTTVTSQGLTPFEVSFLYWLCEDNTDLPCEELCMPYIPGLACKWGPLNDTKPGESRTAHADIIGGTVSQIGCYYQDSKSPDEWGLWTCDYGY